VALLKPIGYGDLRVLFVCAGNAFRSQLAEYVFDRTFEGGYVSFSAGLLPEYAGMHVHEALDPRALQILNRHHVNLPNAICRQVTRDDIAAADIVLVMESWMKLKLENKYPSFSDRIFLLRSFAGYKNRLELHDVNGPVTERRVMHPYKQIQQAILRIKREKRLEDVEETHRELPRTDSCNFIDGDSEKAMRLRRKRG